MTQEEAIDIIENKIQIDVRFCTKEEVEQYQEALTMAITALRPVSREQVEKMWRGEWVCTPNMGVYDTICSKCGYCPGITFWDSDFCPACGSPMTDEAVDMVMERINKMEETGNGLG